MDNSSNGSLLSPAEIAQFASDAGVKKAGLSWWRQLLLGVMAGMFIAIAGNGASIAGYSASSVGIGKMLSGVLFGAGLLMVLLAGAELFTGNCLMAISVLDKKIRTSAMIKNWFFVYIGNAIGGIGYSFLMSFTTQLSMDGNKLAAYSINTAVSKCNLEFTNAFVMGIFCNVLVCIAVWVSYASKDVVGKIVAMYFPIWVFVTAGYEHCIANMYFVPMGIFAKSNPDYVQAAMNQYGLTSAQIDSLNWGNFAWDNLVPVTIGNIIGGSVFVGLVYWLVYIRKSKKK